VFWFRAVLKFSFERLSLFRVFLMCHFGDAYDFSVTGSGEIG
jgi:hypothetical protein